MNNIKNYGQFQLWVLNNFPFTIDDWDSITQYQMLCKCLGALKEQLDVNSDLYQKISDLENLDLQDEVNNKIDEMAESGQLQEIITEYLQINGVLAFNTVSDMISATNIINGSVCKTLGKNNYNDGNGSYYKIRTITSEDEVDGVNIIALDISNTLIAQRIFTYNEKFDEYIKVNNKDEFLKLIQIPNTGIELCKEITLDETITPANNVKIKNGTINYEGSDYYVINTSTNNFSIENVTINASVENEMDSYNNGIIKNDSGTLSIKNCIFNSTNLTCINITAHASKLNVENNIFNLLSGNAKNYVFYSTPREDISNITTPSNVLMFINNKVNNFSVGLLIDADNSIISNNIITNTSAPIACLKLRDSIISNNTITGFVSNGIALGNGTDDLIENVSVIGNSLDGNNLSTNTQTSLVHGINIYKQGGDSDPTGTTHPNIGLSKYITITGNTVKNCYASGIFAYTNGNCVISSNVCTHNQTGILETGNGIGNTSMNSGNINISNNYCCDNTNFGIGVGSANVKINDVNVNDNICNNNNIGIFCGGNNNNIKFDGNLCNNNTSYGLMVNGATSSQILNNTIKNNGTQLYISLRSNECEVIGNDISSTNPFEFLGAYKPKLIKNNIGLTNNLDILQETFINESNNNVVTCSVPVEFTTSWLTEIFKVTVISDRMNSNSQHNIKQKVMGYACIKSSNTNIANEVLNQDIFKSDETTYNITITSTYNTTTKKFDFTATCSNTNNQKSRIIIERLNGTNIYNNVLS